MAVKITKEVYEGLEAVRKSGLTNMFDRPAVIELCRSWGFDEAADWANNNRGLYIQLVMEGPEVEEE